MSPRRVSTRPSARSRSVLPVVSATSARVRASIPGTPSGTGPPSRSSRTEPSGPCRTGGRCPAFAHDSRGLRRRRPPRRSAPAGRTRRSSAGPCRTPGRAGPCRRARFGAGPPPTQIRRTDRSWPMAAAAAATSCPITPPTASPVAPSGGANTSHQSPPTCASWPQRARARAPRQRRQHAAPQRHRGRVQPAVQRDVVDGEPHPPPEVDRRRPPQAVPVLSCTGLSRARRTSPGRSGGPRGRCGSCSSCSATASAASAASPCPSS